MRFETRFKCVECGKLTAGRIGRDGGLRVDTTGRFPRRHSIDGKVCPGCFQEAEWVDVPMGKATVVKSSSWYVKIINKATGAVVEKMGPMPERRAHRCADGVSINLNHDEYRVCVDDKE